MAIKCICGEKANMVRGSKEDLFPSLEVSNEEYNKYEYMFKDNLIPKRPNQRHITKKDIILLRNKDNFMVKRTYLCPKCNRQFDTIEEKEIPAIITIISNDKKSNENFFQPTKYKASLANALRDEDNCQEIVSKIFDDWIDKCESERLEKEYTYSVEELIEFTVDKLIRYSSGKTHYRYLASIDIDLLKIYIKS